jgi:hypothetical protein
MKIIPTGKTVYIVHKGWAKAKNNGAKVTTAKVVGYQNVEGKIVPILKSGKQEISVVNHQIFLDINEAVDAIKSK